MPSALQLGYYCVCFSLPEKIKWDWYTSGHLDVVEPFTAAVILATAVIYVRLAWLAYAEYQHWLDENFSNNEPWRLGWIRLIIISFGGALLVTIGAAAWNAFMAPLDYFGRTPVMLVFAALIYTLGLVGWRYRDVSYPTRGQLVQQLPRRKSRADYVGLLDGWSQQIKEGG